MNKEELLKERYLLLKDKDDIEKAKGLGAEDYFIKSNTDLSTLFEKVKNKLQS